jgi:DNA-binding CsgD family transcriptional regulator
MRVAPAVASFSPVVSNPHSRVTDALQTLVGLTREKLPGEDVNKRVDQSAEEILLDTEIDGYRYLLVRMPLPLADMIHLSPREQEIVRMVAKGHPNKVIADVLNISSWTVCTHLRRIFAKLGVGSRAAMVARILEIGPLAGDHFSSTSHLR